MKHLVLLAIVWIGGPLIAYANIYAGAAFIVIVMLLVDRRRLVSSAKRVNSRWRGSSAGS